MQAIVDHLAKHDAEYNIHLFTLPLAEIDPAVLDFNQLIRSKRFLIKARIRLSHPERSLPVDKPLNKIVERRLSTQHTFSSKLRSLFALF